MLFKEKLETLKNEAVDFINNYRGPETVTLPTGETALDNDDAWIIIGGDTPIVRDKRDQRIREKYFNKKKPYPENSSFATPEDIEMQEEWDTDSIFELADRIHS